MMTNPIRVLLVDDDPDYHLITRDLLSDIQEARFDLTAVTTYDEAAQAISSHQHDVCLIDYRLGARDGLELIREAMAQGCRAPLILMTGQGDHDVDVQAMRAGAADYLVKGEIDAGTLEHSIRYSMERARASEERFRSAFERAVIGMALISLDGRFLQVNGSLCDMLNYAPHELMATTIQAITHPDDLEATLEALRELQHGEFGSCQLETRFLHKRGSVVWVLLSSSLVRDTQGQPLHFISQIQDITSRKQAEQALRESEALLRQSQKMEAIGRLAGGVAHDFNNILTVISGHSALLLRKLTETSPLRKDVEEIQKSSERAAALTRQLLAFSRKQLLDPKVLDLNSVVAGMEKMLRRLIGEDIELQTVLDPSAGRIKADPSQIEQVVLNLVVNARDAMPFGGKLTIEVAAFSSDHTRTLQIGELAPGSYAMLAVTDTGTGMSKEIQSHLFEPFFTTKGPGKGTGLGLATSYGIVKQSGGGIRVYSEAGHGSVFKVYLPVAPEGPEPATARLETSDMVQGNETILVVEDEGPLRSLAACVLRDAGYTVLEAKDGLEGLRVVQGQANRKIDLVVSDVIMPHMGGREMAERLKTILPETRVLFTSGYTDDALSHHGVLNPGVVFLEKPYSPARLASKVREALDQACPAAA
jgi:two-component system cell cycle sensor histidine kinase/response regulator CckA